MPTRRTWAVIGGGVCVALVGGLGLWSSLRGAGRKLPGPCEAEWVIRDVWRVGGQEITIPWSRGQQRHMVFRYDEHHRLVQADDDQDGDGRFEVRLLYGWDEQGRQTQWAYDKGLDGVLEEERRFVWNEFGLMKTHISERPDDAPPTERTLPGGEAMDPLWSLCYGDCLRDAWGNLLEDRAPDGRDVLRYDYGCW